MIFCRKIAALFLIMASLLLGACSRSEIQSDSAETVSTQPAETATAQAAMPTATFAPTRPLPPAIAAPATFTPLPTLAAVPTATPLPPVAASPTPTAAIETATPASEFACPSLSDVADARPSFTMAPRLWPRADVGAGEIYSGYSGAPSLIHLGFDVEGSAEPVIAILDVLDKHQVKTTMFILGSWADVHPDLVREIAARGHEIASHGWSHASFTELTTDEIIAELNRTETLLFELTGQSTKPWVRPPYGARSAESIAAVYAAGWTTVIWSGSTEDWRVENGEDEMCETLQQGVFPGAILYTHSARPEIPNVIDRFIGNLHKKGYTFVPLSVMLGDNVGGQLIPH